MIGAAVATGMRIRPGQMQRRPPFIIVGGLVPVLCIAAGSGCKSGGQSGQWLLNGFFDPAQVGQFVEPRRTEIRASLSILEEPPGIEEAVEPTADDLVAQYSEHVIGPGDALTISIFELLQRGVASAQQVIVSRSGFESLPVLGRIRLAGLTISELEMEIKELLREQQILPDPEVQVSLLNTRSTRFSIIGSVPRPGTYEVPRPDYRMLQAIADAGGVSPALQTIYLFREGVVAAGPPFSPATQPGPNPAGTTRSSLTMSDTSSAPSTSSAPRHVQSPPSPAASSAAPSPAPVDELQILEGGPTESQQAIKWDQEMLQWVIGPADSAPSTTYAEAASSRSAEDGAAFPPAPPELAPAVRIIEIPVKELLSGDPRYNIIVRPMDLINVPPGQVGEYYMMGNVARPGAYELTGRKLTVKEAIAAAGGFGPLAWPSRADLIRRVTGDEEQMIQLDLDAIFAGNAPDFYLKPNDIVNVGSHAVAGFLAVLRNAFRLSYGFGFVYDRNFADSDTFQAKEQLKVRRNQEALQRGVPLI